MSDIFERLGTLFRSIFSDDAGTYTEDGKTKYYDPDMQEAWEELEDFLNEDKNKTKTRTKTQRSRQKAYEEEIKQRRRRAEKEALRKDFENLKVPFDATFEQVKKAYKKLLREYHPDKHADNAEKFRIATEITKKINQSFQKIKAFFAKKNT